MPSVALAIDELEKCGARLTLEQGNIRVVYRTPAAMAPTISQAIAVLKQHKHEAIDFLLRRRQGLRKNIWPSASLEAKRKFGCPSARLYPFVGKKVRTPKGIGQLVQVFSERVAVILDSERVKPETERRMTFFTPGDVCPPDVM